ncbi:hypothetical protein ACFQ3N_01895 [Virgibacillus byunsanensis]|uniref:Uncharacterized protein n=1 Tax=Virgibacillus byunsanensis TaxID=570945 RepID=A0ABW3LJQ7_9BACI
MSKAELEVTIELKLDKPYTIVMFHPVTLEDNNTAEQFQALLETCKKYKDFQIIHSKARKGRIINR